MRKILLFLLFILPFPVLIIATQNTFTGGLWSNGSILNTDTVTADGSIANDSLNGDLSFMRYLRTGPNVKKQVLSFASTWTIANRFIDSGKTETKNYPNIIMTGDGLFLISKTGGAVTPHYLYLQGNDSLIISPDNTLFDSIRCAASTKTTIIPSSGQIGYPAGCKKLIVDGGTFKYVYYFYIIPSDSLPIVESAKTSFVSGNTSLQFGLDNRATRRLYLPKLFSTGATALNRQIDIENNGACTTTVHLTDSLSFSGQLELYPRLNNGMLVTVTDGYPINCGQLVVGCWTNTNTKDSLNIDGSIITLGSGGWYTYGTYGKAFLKMGNGTINNSGPWLGKATDLIYTGTGIINHLTNGLITTAGVWMPTINFNNPSTGTLKLADSLRDSMDIILTDGRDSLAYSVYCRDWINNNADSTFINNLFVSRDFTRNSAYSKRIGGSIWFVNGNNHTMTVVDGGTVGPVIHASVGKNLTAGSNLNLWRLNDSLGAIKMLSYSLQDSFTLVQDTGCQFAALYARDSMQVLAKKHIAINDTSWLQRFILGDSTRVTVRAGKGMKIGAYTTGDMEGTIGNRTSFMSDTAGKRFRLWFPASDTLQYSVFKDCSTNVAIYLDSTSETKGNNRKIKSLSTYPSSLISIIPTSGSKSGGTTITIIDTGGGFVATGSGALVGGLALTDVIRVDYKTITGKTVVHAAGVVSVQPFNSDADTAMKAAAFEYLNDVPVITSISPARGTPLGGTADTINGSSFGTSGTLKWNGATLAPVSWADTKIALITPAGHDSVEVIVTTTQGSDTIKFGYDTIPTLVSVRPSYCNFRYGLPHDTLTVTDGSVIDSVLYGSVKQTITGQTSTRLIVTVAARADTATVNITSYAHWGYPYNLVGGFRFLNQDTVPVFSSFTPLASKTAGGTKLALRVTYAGDQIIDSVNIGGVTVIADSAQGDTLWCQSPALTAGTKNVITIAHYGYRDTVGGLLYAAIYGQALSGRAKCGDTASITFSWGGSGITHAHVGDSTATVLAGASDTLVRFLWPCYTKGRYDVTATATGGTVTFTGGANYSRKHGGIFGLGLWAW